MTIHTPKQEVAVCTHNNWFVVRPEVEEEDFLFGCHGAKKVLLRL